MSAEIELNAVYQSTDLHGSYERVSLEGETVLKQYFSFVWERKNRPVI